MRAYHWVGLLAVSVLSACGGESSLNEGPEGGSDNSGEEPEGDAGDSSDAGAGAGARPATPTGGKSGGGSGGTAGIGEGGAASSTGNTSAGGSETMPGSPAGSTGVGGSPGTPTPGRPPGKGGVIPIPPGMMGGSTGTAEPAVNCKPYSQSTGPGYCDLYRECENTQVYAACSDTGSGTSSCSCQNGGVYGSYAIKKTGMAACEAIADLCGEGGQPKVTGEETCETLYASKGTYNCNVTEQCTRAIEGTDVLVVTNGSTVECFSEGSGNMYCYCSGTPQYKEYRLTGTDGNQACDFVQELCAGETTFGKKECSPSGQSSGQGYCNTSFECRETADLGDGVAAVRYDYRYASCSTSPGGVSTCSCGTNTNGMQFQYEGAASGATCSTAAELCGDPSALELTGSVDCARASQSASRDYCSAGLECLQSGTLGSLEVKAYGYVQTDCSPSSDGKTWNCNCYSGTSQAGTSIASTGDAWADCTAASDKCQGLVEVQIGSSGGFIGRPIPL